MNVQISPDAEDAAAPIADSGPEGAPVVSIICLTYNHEEFIEECIEGFLIQKTDFPIEIVIHDDASTDRTADIIRRYADRHDQLIRPILQTQNQYSRGLCTKAIAHRACRGRYIAFCEGDDFWTDPRKLQKQVDYLEAHPDVVVSGHQATIIDRDGRPTGDNAVGRKHQRDFAARDLLFDHVMVRPATRVYRNVIDEEPPEKARVINGDRFLISLLGQHGGSKFHDDIEPARVRVHEGGIWSLRPKPSRRRNEIKTRYWMARYYLRIGRLDCAAYFLARASFLTLKGNVRLLG